MVTESAQNADFRRKPQIFADSPLLLEIEAFGGRRKPQKTADFRRTPKIVAETAGNRRLGSVTLGPSPLALPYVIMPNCHNAPISRMYGGSVPFTGPLVPLPGGSVALQGHLFPYGRVRSPLLIVELSVECPGPLIVRVPGCP